MTKDQALTLLRRLGPADRRRVLEMAWLIRSARDAGDDRSTSEIVTPVLASMHLDGI